MYKCSFELFKQMHNFELEQKERINARISIPIGILSLLVGGFIYYFRNSNHLVSGGWLYAFYISLAIYAGLIIHALLLVKRAYFGHDYGYMPKASEIHAYVDYYANYYDNYLAGQTQQSKDDYIESQLNNRLYEIYIVAIDKSIVSNELKNRYLSSIGGVLIALIIIGAFSMISFYCAQDKDYCEKVFIVNYNDRGGDIVAKDENNISVDSKQKVTPPPPEPPPLEARIINETFELNPPKIEKKESE